MTNSEAVSLLMSNQYYERGYKQGVSDVLDKIRAEIKSKITKRPGLNFTLRERERNDAFLEVLDIIDRHISGKENNDTDK